MNIQSPGRFSLRHSHFFEEFFIIGVDKEELKQVREDQTILQPQTLYIHNSDNEEDCERRRVVKDFCFPEGIEVKLLQKSDSFSQAQKILFS